MAMKCFVEQCAMRFPPKSPGPIIISSFGSGLLFQEFTHCCKLVQMGYRQIRLILVDTAYASWRQKYLSRDGSCRIYVQSAAELHPEMLRPTPVYLSPGSTKEALETAAVEAVNHTISFVLYNEAIYQFMQWFSTEPEIELQVLLYDSVDAYIADCQLSPSECMGKRPAAANTAHSRPFTWHPSLTIHQPSPLTPLLSPRSSPIPHPASPIPHHPSPITHRPSPTHPSALNHPTHHSSRLP